MTGFDTNAAFRAIRSEESLHQRCRTAYLAAPTPCIASATVRETFRIMMGERNGHGLSAEEGLTVASRLRGAFRVLTATEKTLDRWEHLVRVTGIRGIRTYDAYLAAVLLSHGVTEIVTLDADFAYPGLRTILP